MTLQINFSQFFCQALQISGFIVWLLFVPWIIIIWQSIKQQIILSRTLVYPQAKIIDKRISKKIFKKKLLDKKCIIICESYFLRKYNNPHGLYGKVERHYIFVTLKDYNDLMIGQEVFLAPREVYFSGLIKEEGVCHYAIITSQDEYEAHSKFWNEERFLELSR